MPAPTPCWQPASSTTACSASATSSKPSPPPVTPSGDGPTCQTQCAPGRTCRLTSRDPSGSEAEALLPEPLDRFGVAVELVVRDLRAAVDVERELRGETACDHRV